MSSRSSVALLLLLLAGCANAPTPEERGASTSHLDEADASLEVGDRLTLRLSASIRADLLPHARLAEVGPYQFVTYGAPPRMRFIEHEGWRCEIRGARPRPGMSERYFPPTLPNPLHLTVVSAPRGTSGTTAFLRTSGDDDDTETTWSVDCVKNEGDDRLATLGELREAFDAGSSVTLE